MTFNWRALSARSRTTDVRGAEAEAELHTIMLPTDTAHEPASMTIRLADCDGQRNRANMLLKRMYSWRGFTGRHEIPAAPNCVTFTAAAGDDVVGTLTLTVDSPARLAIDRTFPDEVEKFRSAAGAKLCELTKFAFDTSAPARPRLAALFHIIFIYGSMHYDCTDLFIEVVGRHARFYETTLGFKRVGAPRMNASVGFATQLMWLNVSAIRRYISEHTRTETRASRSLYAHFFSAREAEGIYRRLASMAEPQHPPAGKKPSLFAQVLGKPAPSAPGLRPQWKRERLRAQSPRHRHAEPG